MSYTQEDRTVALAGVFQAAALVHQIAHRGTCPEATMDSSLMSLFVTNPQSTIDVFGDYYGIRLGLQEMGEVLDRQTSHKDIEILRYSLNLVHLSGRLRRRKDMLDLIGKRIEQARHTADHFGYTHSNTLSNLASVYLDSISTFSQRIQVTGNPSHLRVDSNAVKIRALLLAGIRSAILWHQTGGRRWQLVFGRQRYIKSARQLAASLGTH
ncbi:high frequency lysogenization protein HflD [Mangrovitalea sediminis]|uniref:high frequency lysogenization protein HflD n=1 Tax=Mangrovitalea sediminis TaxID=1982043 RepID=UPI000BE5FC8C|nr:high frequency lysogenization protein HflD [Mangrovitalea sediminis]